MKTTKKEFKIQIQKHILEGLPLEGFNEALTNVVTDFHNWYDDYEQRLNPNRQDAFTQYLLCLPSTINLEFSDYGIFLKLKEWFENMGETYKEQSACKECILYYHLIYREFSTLCKKYNVTF